jgi:hypothetical protein
VSKLSGAPVMIHTSKIVIKHAEQTKKQTNNCEANKKICLLWQTSEDINNRQRNLMLILCKIICTYSKTEWNFRYKQQKILSPAQADKWC